MLLERGAHSYVVDLRRPPLRRAVQRQHRRAVPRRRADLARPTASARGPWDIEGAGSVCTLCPAQCNVTLTVRDERALRVLARENAEVDDGWLCDKGRFAYQSVPRRRAHHRAAAARRRRAAPRHLGARAERGRGAPARAPARATGAIAGGRCDQRGGPAARAADARGARLPAPRLAPRRQRCRSSCTARWATRGCRRASSDLEFAHAVLVLDADPVNDAPILDLRLRKGIRRRGLQLARRDAGAELARAAAPSSRVRFAPGARRRRSPPRWRQRSARRRDRARASSALAEIAEQPAAVSALAALLRGAGRRRSARARS